MECDRRALLGGGVGDGERWDWMRGIASMAADCSERSMIPSFGRTARKPGGKPKRMVGLASKRVHGRLSGNHPRASRARSILHSAMTERSTSTVGSYSKL